MKSGTMYALAVVGSCLLVAGAIAAFDHGYRFGRGLAKKESAAAASRRSG